MQRVDLVSLARLVMNSQHSDLVGTWPRAAAILGRQALEEALQHLWDKMIPEISNASSRAQMLCLSVYVDGSIARRYTYTWHALSAACHHHAYDLPPVASELEGWLDEVEALITELADRIE